MSPSFGPQMLAHRRRVGSRPIASGLTRASLAAGVLVALSCAAVAAPLVSGLALSGASGNGFTVPKRREGSDDDGIVGDDNDPSTRPGRKWRSRLLGSDRLQERLQLLSDLGLHDSEIAEAIPKSSPRSVRRWRLDGVTDSREAARWRPVDDLCAIVGYLLADGTYDEHGAVAWLRSRHPELKQRYPLEALGQGAFHDVLNAAEITLGTVTLGGSQPAGPVSRAIATQGHATADTSRNGRSGPADDAPPRRDEVTQRPCQSTT
jgi:hypothetical protein